MENEEPRVWTTYARCVHEDCESADPGDCGWIDSEYDHRVAVEELLEVMRDRDWKLYLPAGIIEYLKCAEVSK